MLRWTIMGGLAWLWLLSAGCGDDDGSGTKVSDVTGKNPSSNGTAAAGDTESIGIGGGNVGTGTGGRGGIGGGSAAGNGGGNGNAGDGNAGDGNAGNGDAGDGNAGVGGADDAGAGGTGGALAGSGGLGGIPGTGGTSGTGQCNLVCPLGTHCELADVTCIQAPCNPVPSCVTDSGSGGMGGGAVGAICGTRGAGPCPDGQFCNHPIGADCGRADEPGSCEAMPGACTREFQPVCGCDGNTYSNECGAASEGVSIERDGEC